VCISYNICVYALNAIGCILVSENKIQPIAKTKIQPIAKTNMCVCPKCNRLYFSKCNRLYFSKCNSVMSTLKYSLLHLLKYSLSHLGHTHILVFAIGCILVSELNWCNEHSSGAIALDCAYIFICICVWGLGFRD